MKKQSLIVIFIEVATLGVLLTGCSNNNKAENTVSTTIADSIHVNQTTNEISNNKSAIFRIP